MFEEYDYDGSGYIEIAELRGFLDGMHCLDEVCIAVRMSEKKVLERLRSGRFGEVIIFNK